jgi:Flp pilus assembly protein TadB
MLKILFMLVAAVSAVAAVVLLVIGMRQRQRRSAARARRVGEYSERRTQWRDYISRDRKPRRLTDERTLRD